MVETRRHRILDVSIYNSGIWKQLERYGNPTDAMHLYLDTFDGAERVAMISGGPRLLAVITAIPTVQEIVMYDIFPGPLEATDDYMKNPDIYWEKYPILRDEIDFLKQRCTDRKPLKPRLERSLVRLCLRDEFEFAGDFDAVMAEEVALHPPPEGLREQSNHTLPILLDDADRALRDEGKFVFTAYPGMVGGTVVYDGLLYCFNELLGNKDVSLCDDGKWLHIDRARECVFPEGRKFQESKYAYWLNDLSRVRMYSYREVKDLAEDRFIVPSPRNIHGGMFPFAKRSYYVLTKTNQN